MEKRKLLKFGSVGSIIAAGIFVFYFTPELLSQQVLNFNNFPLGTPISWILLFCYSVLMFWLFPSKQTPVNNCLSKVMRFSIVLSFCWGFISRLLAGNWAFSFIDNQLAFKTWIGISCGIVFLPVLCFTILGLVRFCRLFQN